MCVCVCVLSRNPRIKKYKIKNSMKRQSRDRIVDYQ